MHICVQNKLHYHLVHFLGVLPFLKLFLIALVSVLVLSLANISSLEVLYSYSWITSFAYDIYINSIVILTFLFLIFIFRYSGFAIGRGQRSWTWWSFRYLVVSGTVEFV